VAAQPWYRGGPPALRPAGGVSEPSLKRGAGQARARGEVLVPGVLSADTARIELNRVQPAPAPSGVAGVAGVVTGTWHPDGPDGEQASGCLAVIRLITAA